MGYTQPLFNVRKVAGGYNIYPDGVTTDDLTIYPNPVDSQASIVLNGASHLELHPASGGHVKFYSGTTEIARVYYSPDDMILEGVIANKNIYLKPNGTGLVKFGTRTATGDVACNGHLDILDAAGNTVKLMTTA
jgi:hypothetical protein